MSIIGSELLLGSSVAAYAVEKSIRLMPNDKITRTPASTTNRRTWTLSCWVKRASKTDVFLFKTGGASYTAITLDAIGTLTINPTNAYNASNADQILADSNGWYHVVVAFDTTQATQANRVKAYVNGTQLTFTTNTTPLNLDTFANTTVVHELVDWNLTQAYYADYRLIDGQQLDASSFGEFDATGLWVPKKYTGTYGTNGFYLDFSDNTSAANLVADKSGNGNNFTPTGISVTAGITDDSLYDSPSKGSQTDTGLGGQVSGNYCTLDPGSIATAVSTAEAGLRFQVNNTGGSARGTIAISSGKYYWEVYVNQAATAQAIGIYNIYQPFEFGTLFANGFGSYAYTSAGNKVENGGVTTAYGATWGTVGDIIGCAFDSDAGTITFYKNGVSQGVAFTGITGVFTPAIYSQDATGVSSLYVNFGQRAFSYPVSGFKCLCSTNITSLISQPENYYSSVVYTGNGSILSISSLLFNPDLVWLKSRSSAGSHALFDTLRGVENYLKTNATDLQTNDVNSLTAFNSNGFTLGSSTAVNQSTVTFAGWCFDSGSSTVTNTSGTITSSVRANTAAGFSVVTYAGGTTGTVGHGLGAPPDLILAKSYTGTIGFFIVYSSIPNMGKDVYLQTNNTNTATFNSNVWGTATPNSTVFGVKSGQNNSLSGSNHVAYCFRSIPGLCQVGQYTGAGASAQDIAILCDFTPATIIIKCTNSVSNWGMFDRNRDLYNKGTNNRLTANTNNVEASVTKRLHYLCNGFRLFSNDADDNLSGGVYLYIALAYNPFDSSNAQAYLT